MKAVVIAEHGGPEVLRMEQRPAPRPAPDEVLLDVKAVGLNHLDTWVRRGVPGHTFPLPLIPGCDFSGVVAEVGSCVRGVEVGQRVLVAPGVSCGRCAHCAAGDDNLCAEYGIFGETCDGGCAEQAVVHGRNVIAMPEGLPFVQAAAFPLTFLTAWHMLMSKCRLRAGDDVLVHAAGSGVGTAALQIAALHGARVIATAGSEAKLEKARALGAHHTVCYADPDWPRQVKAISGRRGVDIVIEHVGEATMPGSLRCLAKGGRLVTCGATSGPRLEADLRHLFFKNIAILGSTMGSRGELHRIVKLVGRGLLAPVIDRVLPLDQVAVAHAAMLNREQFGKIVLTIGEPS
ncbi:MAG: alcohol dehydrogenase [Planctomycetota bacterium]|nr:MAG: alcohol dehydrogenase [Planctomycetota bacterium]